MDWQPSAADALHTLLRQPRLDWSLTEWTISPVVGDPFAAQVTRPRAIGRAEGASGAGAVITPVRGGCGNGSACRDWWRSGNHGLEIWIETERG